MFEVFQTERSSGRPWRRRDTLAASAGVHALVLVGVSLIPVRTEFVMPGAPMEETVTFLEILQKQEKPAPPARKPEPAARSDEPDRDTPPAPEEPPKPRARVASAERPVLLGRPAPPPVELPKAAPGVETAGDFVPTVSDRPVELAAGPPAGESAGEKGEPAEGTAAGNAGDGTGSGSGSGSEGASAGEPIDIALVAERPILRNRSQMERLWRRLYPRALNARNIEGETVISFVIDTEGRVEPLSIRLLDATHPDFGEATLKGAPKLRFRPGKVGGRPVRVRVQLPVHWRIEIYG